MYKRFIKRPADLVAASVLLVILSPILLIVVALIRFSDGKPIIFKQVRFGKDKKPFTVYKFRTMKNSTPKNCPTIDLYDHGSYITKIGSILRKLSIDEVPQLLNVIRGEMSIVGPRPVILKEAELIDLRDIHGANHCLPGITGWAQVNGRDELRIEKKALMDGEYSKKIGVLMDLKCIMQTLRAVMSFRGYREGSEEVLKSEVDLGIKELPLVSVVVPVYNAEDFILDTLETVLSQTYENWELIFIDDCSADKSVDIIRSYAERDSRIRLFVNHKNLGAGPSRNIGIKESVGEYIAFLDADDFWHKDKLKIQVEFMLNKECSFSFTGYEFADDKGIPSGKIVKAPRVMTYRKSLMNNKISTITVMFDLNAIDKDSLYMSDAKIGEDVLTWWRILREFDIHAYGIGEVLSYYRRTKKTASSNKGKSALARWKMYRNNERVCLPMSVVYFMSYVFNSVKRRV